MEVDEWLPRAGDVGEEIERDWLLMGTGSVCDDENVLKVILVMVVHVCEYPNNHWIAIKQNKKQI